jgi:hypothetical protein
MRLLRLAMLPRVQDMMDAHSPWVQQFRNALQVVREQEACGTPSDPFSTTAPNRCANHFASHGRRNKRAPLQMLCFGYASLDARTAGVTTCPPLPRLQFLFQRNPRRSTRFATFWCMHGEEGFTASTLGIEHTTPCTSSYFSRGVNLDGNPTSHWLVLSTAKRVATCVVVRCRSFCVHHMCTRLTEHPCACR